MSKIELLTCVNVFFLASAGTSALPRFVSDEHLQSGKELLRTFSDGRMSMLEEHPSYLVSYDKIRPLCLRAKLSYQIASDRNKKADLKADFGFSASTERAGRKFSLRDIGRITVKLSGYGLEERELGINVPIGNIVDFFNSDKAQNLSSPKFVQGVRDLFPITAEATRQRFDVVLAAMK